MRSIKTNIVANYVGRGVSALLSLLFIPIYIHYLGIEAYGLVGFYALLLTFFGLLDLGLSPTVSRELARLSVLEDSARQSRDLVRTLETIYWSIGIVIGVAVIAGAGLIARRWVNAEHLPAGTVQTAVMLIGLVIALQWPSSFYEGGLYGLQRMLLYNGIQAALQIARALGAVVVLRYVAPTIVAFFAWQVAMSAISATATALVLWRALPAGPRPRFSMPLLRQTWRFAGSMTVISVVSIVLTQADKVILSKTLTLSAFGYYTLAFTVGAALYNLIYPINGAVFPRLSQYAAQPEGEAIARTYHAACQLMSVITGPAALMLIAFAPEVMFLWTRDAATVHHTATLVRLVTAGTMLNGFVTIPYSLQLAFGWTRLPLYTNCILLVVQIPALVVATQRYGGIGAASVLLAMNCIYLIVPMNIMYRRLLTTERWRWYVNDIFVPLAAAGCVVAAARLLIAPLPAALLVVSLAVAGLLAMGAAALAVPVGRSALLQAAETLGFSRR